MRATYRQRGEALDYTAEKALKSGEVVSLGTRIGVAGESIAAAESGTIHVVGVFEMEKAAETIAMGDALYFDVAEEKITTVSEGNVAAGYAAAPAASGDDTVLVKLLG